MKECRILKWKQVEKKGKGKPNEKHCEETVAIVTAHDDMFVFCDDGHVNITCTERNFGYIRMGNEVSCKIVGMRDILDADIKC